MKDAKQRIKVNSSIPSKDTSSSMEDELERNSHGRQRSKDTG